MKINAISPRERFRTSTGGWGGGVRGLSQMKTPLIYRPAFNGVKSMFRVFGAQP